MTVEETREQTATDMAIVIFFKLGFGVGLAFNDKYGERAEKAFEGELSHEKKSWDMGALSGNGGKRLLDLFQWIVDTARENLEERGDDESHAWYATINAVRNHKDARQLLAGNRLSYG